MATIRERAPFLFEAQVRDVDGRLVDDPKVPGHILSTGPRVPSPVEVVNFVLSAHHISPDAPAAIDIVNSLKELAEGPKTAPAAPASGQGGQPAAAPAWQGRKRWTPPAAVADKAVVAHQPSPYTTHEPKPFSSVLNPPPAPAKP